MKKLILASLIMLATIGVSMAQRGEGGRPGGTPEERAKLQTKQLTEALTLTEDQQKQVLALNLERGKKMEAARGEGGGGREAFMAIAEDYEKKLNGLLTDAQKEKYKTVQAEMRQRRGPGGPGGGQGGGGRQN